MATRTYPSFFIYKDTAGYWRWRYQAANHRTIADSAEGYNNKQDCLDAIALVKQCWNKEIWE